MQADCRADDVCPSLLLPSPKGVLGLTTISQYIYVFFPEKIRVYEQLPSRPSPELVEEIYLSKKNICRFAVSQEYIAVLFEDSGLEVRLRQYWEVVQYSSCLQESSAAIDSLEIDANKVYYRFKKDEENQPTFGFIDLSDKVQEIQYWQQTKPLQKLIHRHKLGSIPDFYVSLMENQIRFGMYYQEQPTVLKEFEFGTLTESDPDNKVLSVHLLESQEIHKEAQSEKKDLFLVKLVEEIQKKETPNKKKNKNKDKANNSNNTQETRKLKLKYIRFFEEEVHYLSEEENITPEDKKFKVFEQMLHSMQQIQANTNCEKSDFFGNLTNPAIVQHASKDKDLWKHFDIPISQEQLESLDIIRKGSTIYLNTGTQILSFAFKQGPCLEVIQQLPKNEDFYKVKDICQHGLVLYGQALFAMPFTSNKVNSEEKKNQEKVEKQKTEFSKEGNQKQKQKEIYPQPKKKETKEEVSKIISTNSTAMQTELPTDVFLDQFQEQQLSEIIDKLFEKKKVFDQETETQKTIYSSYDAQTDEIVILQDDQLNKNSAQTDVQKEDAEEPIPEIIQIERNHQSTQVQTPQVVYHQKGVGEYLPLCPECHHCSLTAISKSLKKLEDNSGNKWTTLVKDSLKQEQEKIKTDVLAKIKSIVDSVVGSTVVPNVQARVKTVLDQKLTEVNSYIYSLVVNNLATLSQELEKDVVRQKGIRNELLKKQMHEIEESKKAVAQMLEICKVREIQKIVFFENIEKKFTQIQTKVIDLQGKVKVLTKSFETKDDALYEEIENIKSMLLEQLKQEGQSIDSAAEDEKVEGAEEDEDENEEEDEEIPISQEESVSSQEGQSEAVAIYMGSEMMRAQPQFAPPPFSPHHQPQYWQPPPPPYSYYPQYPSYQPQYYVPTGYQGYYPGSFPTPSPPAPMHKPSKKLPISGQQLERYSIPMEVLKKNSKPATKRRVRLA